VVIAVSVYIKGMEMPKSGIYTCELGVIDENTAVLTILTPIDEPQRSYKLVPVPPHGRLIDADALLGHMKKIHDKWKMEGHYTPTTDDEIMTINMPTIIEAEEG
jgi:hypothetical protein